MAAPARRLGRVCRHLVTQSLSPKTTAAVTDLGKEVQAILQELGPWPLQAGCRKILYKLDEELPSLPERETMEREMYRSNIEAKGSPELVTRIKALSPPPCQAQNGEKLDQFIQRLMASEEPATPAADDGASDGNLQVVKTLLLYAAGAMDEAHNLAVTTQVSKRYKGSGARRDALYAHAMIHRQEGVYKDDEHDPSRPGGNVGFLSAGQFFQSIENHTLYPKLMEEATKLAAGKTMMEAEVKQMGGVWDPLRFVKILMEAEQTKDWDYAGQIMRETPEVQQSLRENDNFCTTLMNMEWRFLLEHVLARTKDLAAVSVA